MMAPMGSILSIIIYYGQFRQFSEIFISFRLKYNPRVIAGYHKFGTLDLLIFGYDILLHVQITEFKKYKF